MAFGFLSFGLQSRGQANLIALLLRDMSIVHCQLNAVPDFYAGAHSNCWKLVYKKQGCASFTYFVLLVPVDYGEH